MRARFSILLLCAVACAQAVFEPEAAHEHTERVSNVDIQHYAIELDLDLEQATIAGAVAVDFHARVPGLRVLVLDARELTVTAVEQNGAPLAFEQDGDALRISLRQPLANGQASQVRITYAGAPRTGMHFIRPSPEHPHLPYQVHTQGECEDSAFWFPCYDFPNDRASHSLDVTVDEPYTVIAAGELRNVELVDEGRRKFSYFMATPHPVYLTTLIAGEYTCIEEEWRGRKVQYFVEPVDAERAQRSFGKTPAMLDWFSDRIGVEYPYTKYAQTCVRHFAFGGMENISATTQTRRTLHDAHEEPYRSSDGLVAHELAHQWFGDLLTCTDWSHIWLNEGFATYFTQLWFEHEKGREAFQLGMWNTQNSYKRAGRSPNRRPVVFGEYVRPIEVFFDGTVYPGGASRLHMLRYLLGDEAFWKAVHHYTVRFREANVTTDDLRAALEESSGRDLERFFEQWFYRPGFPDFRVSWKYLPEAGMIALTAEQTQSGEGGRPEVFAMPVAVEVTCDEGVQTLRWPLEERKQTLYLPVPSKPKMVLFDKGHWLTKDLDFTKSVDEWLFQLRHDSDAAGRLAAAEVLGAWLRRKDKKPDLGETHEGPPDLAPLDATARARVVEVLRQAAREDGQERVRQECLQALRARPADEVLAVFEAALDDPDKRVVRRAVEALGGYAGEHDSAYVRLRAVAEGDDPVLAAAALRGISGRLSYEELEAWLERPERELSQAAFDLLFDKDRERAKSLVLHFTAPEHDEDLRRSALGKLGEFPGWEPGLEALRSQLGSPYIRWRSHAARTLSRVGDASDLPRLIAVWESEPADINKGAMEGAITGLRKRLLEAGTAPLPARSLQDELRARRAQLEAEREAAEAARRAARARSEALAAELARLRERLSRLGMD